MTKQENEARSRLERMRAQGDLDRARETVDKAPPVLEELGLDVAGALDLLGTDLSRLESVGSRPSHLEAIVKAVGRPPLVIKDNVVQGVHSLSDEFPNKIPELIAGVEHLLPSVGRMEFLMHDLAWGGTAWVVREESDHFLVATNRHVAKIVARRTAQGRGVFMFAPANVPYGAQVDFIEEAEAEPDPEAVFRVTEFTYIADDASADVAIGRIAKTGSEHALTALELSEEDGGDKDLVAVVGYPASDGLRNDVNQMERYFKGLYDVKRFAPGFLRVSAGVSILSHDCTTLGGNSGSPVIRLEDKKVVGLHFAGRFAVGNSAVRASTLNAVLDGTVPTSIPGADLARPERADGSHDSTHFEGRAGYDPDFLQVANVPLPKTPRHIALSQPTDATEARPDELRYQNFGVLFSGALKSPILAALNIDGQMTRPQKRGNDKWFSDERLPLDQQLTKKDYDSPDIDRGHLIRRAATNWGETEEQAARANADSFHYTVASPQHRLFNRSRAQWLGIEDYIMSNARTHGFRCCVFTGPIFEEAVPGPMLKDTGAPIPLQYFKVVAMLAEDPGSHGILRLHATAYVLSQGQLIQRMLISQGDTESVEGFAFAEFKTFQTRISDLEQLSGFNFGTLRDADPLARELKAMAQEGPTPKPVVTVSSYDNIVL